MPASSAMHGHRLWDFVWLPTFRRQTVPGVAHGAESWSEKVDHTPLATAPDLVAEMILPCSWRFGAEALTRVIPQHSAQAVDERCAQEEHS